MRIAACGARKSTPLGAETKHQRAIRAKEVRRRELIEEKLLIAQEIAAQKALRAAMGPKPTSDRAKKPRKPKDLRLELELERQELRRQENEQIARAKAVLAMARGEYPAIGGTP